jgi:hypothetical protein
MLQRMMDTWQSVGCAPSPKKKYHTFHAFAKAISLVLGLLDLTFNNIPPNNG